MNSPQRIFSLRSIQCFQWQFERFLDSRTQLSVREIKRRWRIGVTGIRRVRYAPMHCDGSTVPHRAGFARRTVAHGNDDIDSVRAGAAEGVPRLRRQPRRRMALLFEFAYRTRIHCTCRVTASAGTDHASSPQFVEQYLCQDATAGVARAQHQDAHRRQSWSSTAKRRLRRCMASPSSFETHISIGFFPRS